MFACRVQCADADDQITQGGQIVGSVLGADGGAILAEGHIADIVNRVFNTPVTTAKGLDLSSTHLGGWATGQDDFGFLGDAHAFEMMSQAADHRRLRGVGESGVLRSDFERVDFPSLMPSVGLVQSDVRRGKKNPPGRWKGGRVGQRVWVDWL